MRCKRFHRFLVEGLEARRLLTTYYVSPVGNDSNAGTSDAAAFATLQQAANMVATGDTVIVRAGTYSGGFYLNWNSYDRVSGTPTSPIRFLADPGVVITGRNDKTPDAIDLEHDANYVIIKGFTIDNRTGYIQDAGVRVAQSTGVQVLNCSVNNAGSWGIFSSHTTNMLVQGNTCSNSQLEHGIYMSNSPVGGVVRGNTIFGCNGSQAAGIHVNGDISQGGTGMADNMLIEDNVIYNNATNGINCDGIENSRIQNNVIYQNGGNGISMYYIDAAHGSTNNVIVNNTIVCLTSGGNAIEIQDGSTGNTVYNNVLYAPDAVRDSIMVSSDSMSGFRSDYNAVFGGFSNDDGNTTMSLASWQAATGQDTHSLVISNLGQWFVNLSSNNYHLATGSPGIDAGTAMASPNQPPTHDLDGNPRPQGANYDIGAYEVQGPAVPPAAPSNLAGMPADPLSATLSWTDHSNNETAFSIERQTGGGNFSAVGQVGANVTTYTDAGLTPGMTYFYRVRSTNAWGASGYSNVIPVVGPAAPASPPAPTNLVATPDGYGTINLTWITAPAPTTALLLERSANGSGFQQIASLSPAQQGYVDAELLPSTGYAYRLRATNFGSDSAYSNTALATTVAVGTGPFSLWTASDQPVNANGPFADPSEVGCRFRSDVSGYITAISFYKGNQNTGSHIAHLWDAAGDLLASAPYANETTWGWQTATLPQPILIQAGQGYVASYFAPNGSFATDFSYFTKGDRSNGPLHAFQDSTGTPNGVAAVGAAAGTFPVTDYAGANFWVDVVFIPTRVLGRHVFYNDSAYDGDNPAANTADDTAIAPDKQALLPGEPAGFANYTSYSNGINGIMVDLAALPGAPNLQDFSFEVGDGSGQTAWTPAPLPSAIVLRRGAGVGGSDRVEITWPNGAIRNQWLQVTIHADAVTGLSLPDVFYFGNLAGASGTPPVNGQFAVTSQDVASAAADPHTFLNPASVVDPNDFNRDGCVDALDQLIARNSEGNWLGVMGAWVASRFVFYNNSTYDNYNPAPNGDDPGAIAPDKQALLPGQGSATFANYTSYSQGINGIMVDIANLPGTLSLADFSFRAGNTPDPTQWSVAPVPNALVEWPGEGAGGATRVVLTWPDGAIRNQWLQVAVEPTVDTGLVTADVFYFGNLIGETGKPAVGGSFVVTAADLTAAANDPHSFLNPTDIEDPADFNRDGMVDALDELIARTDMGASLTVLQVPAAQQPLALGAATLANSSQQAASVTAPGVQAPLGEYQPKSMLATSQPAGLRGTKQPAAAVLTLAEFWRVTDDALPSTDSRKRRPLGVPKEPGGVN